MKLHLAVGGAGVDPVTWEIASLKFKFLCAKTNSFCFRIG